MSFFMPANPNFIGGSEQENTAGYATFLSCIVNIIRMNDFLFFITLLVVSIVKLSSCPKIVNCD